MIGGSYIKWLKKIKKKVKTTKKLKKPNPIAKDLRTSKYKQRLVANKKTYNRKKEKNIL